MCYGTHYAFTLLQQQWVTEGMKGGGGSSSSGGGGGFSGDHLPVSGACSCRARFFYFILFFPSFSSSLFSMLYAGVCESVYVCVFL
jgi:hypothetical protein